MLGVPVGLLPTIENQIKRRLKLDAVIEIGGHRSVVRIACILLIDDRRHFLESLNYLIFGNDAVVYPVSNMLTRDTQCNPEFLGRCCRVRLGSHPFSARDRGEVAVSKYR